MFWKKNNLQKQPISIANRLTFFYSFVTISILIILTIVAYSVVKHVIITAEKQYIIDEAHVLSSLLRKNPNNISRLTQEVNAVPEALKDAEYRYYIRIYDQNNKTLMKTPSFDKAVVEPKFPALDIHHWADKAIHWKTSDGRKFLSMTAPIQFDQNNKPNLFMQMALDGTYPEAIINTYWLKVVIFLGVFAVLIAILGRIVTQSGLKPLYEMVNITKAITLEHLTQRIETKNWPKELESLGESLNGMLGRIEIALKRISESTTELAHELRTPLNNLMLATEVVLSKDRNIPEYKHVLESNLEEYTHLLNLTENILLLSRIQNQQVALKKTEIDLEKEIQNLCEFYSIMASEKNIMLECDVRGKIMAERTFFRMAISNLISNAIQYTPNNGKISIKGFAEKSGYKIIITDTGIGIPKEHINLIFERFYRIKADDLKYYKGVGLGLSLVKSIMDIHGAKIGVSSQVSQGTAFEISSL